MRRWHPIACCPTPHQALLPTGTVPGLSTSRSSAKCAVFCRPCRPDSRAHSCLASNFLGILLVLQALQDEFKGMQAVQPRKEKEEVDTGLELVNKRLPKQQRDKALKEVRRCGVRTAAEMRLFFVCCLDAVLLKAALTKMAEARQQAWGTTCCPVVASKASATVDDILCTVLVIWA